MSILVDSLKTMSDENNKCKLFLNRVFHIFCVLSALSLTCWCFHKYMQDKDVSLVNYKRFHSDRGSIYPSLTLCFNNPFLNDKLKTFGDGINTSTYYSFLEGLLWDKRMVDIDYDNVTVNLDDYLLGARIVLANGSLYKWDSGSKTYYVGMRTSSMKCFTFDVPFVKDVGVEYLVVTIKNSIFPYGFRPMHHVFDPETGTGTGFQTILNYPHQIMRSQFTAKWIWDSLGENATQKWVGMRFKIKNIESFIEDATLNLS